MQRRQLFCAYLWHFAVSQYINHTHRCRRAELKQQFVLPVLRRCLRGAGSADSCKMPNLSHTLPNCQHSLAVCLFICFAHGLHDLINTPAKLLQRPLTPVSSHCCPYCQSPLLAFPATLQLRLENFFLSLHTHATRSHTRSHTHLHTQCSPDARLWHVAKRRRRCPACQPNSGCRWVTWCDVWGGTIEWKPRKLNLLCKSGVKVRPTAAATAKVNMPSG